MLYLLVRTLYVYGITWYYYDIYIISSYSYNLWLQFTYHRILLLSAIQIACFPFQWDWCIQVDQYLSEGNRISPFNKFISRTMQCGCCCCNLRWSLLYMYMKSLITEVLIQLTLLECLIIKLNRKFSCPTVLMCNMTM